MISNHNLLDDDISNNNDRNKQVVPRISDYSILENNNKTIGMHKRCINVINSIHTSLHISRTFDLCWKTVYIQFSRTVYFGRPLTFSQKTV